MNTSHRRLACLLLAGLLASLTGCGDADPGAVSVQEDPNPEPTPEPEPEPEPEPDPLPDVEDFPAVPSGVETVLSQDAVSAGTAIDVTCRVHDESGTTIEVAEDARVQITISPSESLVADESQALRYTPVKAGTAVITCAYPALGLVDPTPAELSISPGPPEQVLTELDTNVMSAGRTANATCLVFDAYGNAIEDAQPRVLIEPTGEGVMVQDKAITVTAAGFYTVTCHVDGAAEQIADALEVVATRAAGLMIAKVPEQEVYALGQVVEIDSTVVDRFGNTVQNATVAIAVVPEAVSFGAARFRFDEEGLYTIGAEVTSATENGLPITAETQLIVNGAGPDINCISPIDGDMLDTAPGGNVTFRARVTDVNGVESVRINDQNVTVDEVGVAEVGLTTRFGINFVDIIATDSFGEQNSRTCAFLVSDDWIAEGAFLDNAVALRLAQSAIDDGNRSGGFNSLADLLHTVLNSQGMVNTLHTALSNSSPFINQCVQNICLPFIGCSCAFRLRVDYRGIRIDGPNAATLRLVNNGLRATATVRNVRLDIGIGGTVSTSGSATLSSLAMDMTFDLAMNNNRPNITLRNINSVNVGGVSTNFSGLAGFVIDIIVDLFEGTVRNLIRDQLRNFVRDSFDEILSGVISGLDISSLGSTFNVPRLDGGTIPLGFGLRFSSVATNTSRTIFGLGLRFTGPINHGGRTLGAPRPPGGVLMDPTTNRPIAATLHVGMLSQVLHALWRGGMFDASLTGGDIGAPDEIQAELRTNLPPVIELQDNGRVKLSLGAARLDLVYPGLFDEPLSVTIGAVAQSRVRLVNGDELSFDQIQIDELIFSTEEISLDPVTRGILEDFLRGLIQSVVDNALNNALPSLPIPSFTLPNSLSEFGIPRGTELGLNAPAMTTRDNTHFVIEGNFGTR